MQVIRDSFEFISEEMSLVVERSAVHPMFQEVHDYSTGIFFYDGSEVSVIARASSVPVHIFASVTSVEALIERFGGTIEAGDAFLTADPYHGGSHHADWTMMKPVPVGEGRFLIPSVRAHMSDFGGAAPGGYSPDQRDSWQEGYRISPVRIVEAGEVRQDLWDLVTGNSRLQGTLRGDLMAILGGCNVGARRTEGLIERYGSATVVESTEHSMEYAGQRLREVIGSWPDGEYHGSSTLDHDFAGRSEITVRVKVTVSGDRLEVDFEGSDPEARGFVNSVLPNTASYVFIAIYAALDDDIPVNSGAFRQVDVRAPEGSVVNPWPPAPVMFSTVVIGGNVGEAVMNAFEQFIPERVGNVGLNFNAVSQHGRDSRYGDDFYFFIEYGSALPSDGGAYGKDGWGAWSAPMSEHTFANCETQELQFPIVYERYEFVDHTCAPGQWRGLASFAMQRRLVGERPAQIDVSVVGNRHPLPGFAGGAPGGTSYSVVKPRQGEEIEVRLALAGHRVEPGDAIFSLKGGGGGWGDPLERDPELVLEDHLDGWTSRDAVRADYGVVLETGPGGELRVDRSGTERLRRLRRSSSG